jgi:hypothetical protein
MTDKKVYLTFWECNVCDNRKTCPKVIPEINDKLDIEECPVYRMNEFKTMHPDYRGFRRPIDRSSLQDSSKVWPPEKK